MRGCLETNPPGVGLTDKDILVRCGQGDATSFGVLYDRYAPGLFFFAHSFLEDAALAEDVVQEAFLRLLDLSPEGLEDSVRGLLYTILRNLARDEVRKRRTRLRSYPSLAAADADDPPPTTSEHLEALSRALHALPPEQRETVLLKAYGQLTFGEIADHLRVPEATVKSRYRYGLEKMAQLLGENQEGP